jgi:hypothetical protein
MSNRSNAGRWPSARPGLAGALALGLAVAGCAAGPAFSVTDLRLSPVGDTLYVFARSRGVSRNFCSTLGGDVNRAESRLASEGRAIQLGRVMGCYTVRHIIVCAEGDDACVAHEERHRREGDFH